MNPHFVEITFAQPVESLEVSIGEGGSGGILEAHKNGTISCLVKGGRPAPGVNLEVEGLEQSKIVEGKQTQEPNDDGIYETEQASWEVNENNFKENS